MSYVIVFVVLYTLSVFFLRSITGSKAYSDNEREQYALHFFFMTYFPVVNIVCAFCLFVFAFGILTSMAIVKYFNGRR